ncbi:hypothetical protein LXA43DRAFT_1056106 [Ganoderma leucocontextum]|nr:hypothetical protein LXA43DRAFT_1056106 [Ganoderma leucocontextum]
MQSSASKPRRIHHARAASLSFSSFSFPSERPFPLYAHCNTKRSQRAPRNHSNTAHIILTRRQDLMQTVDCRYSKKHTRRSSFALSDIFELDEEEVQVEFEISPILPSTPTSAYSGSTATSSRSTFKSRITTVVVDLAHTLKTKLNRSLNRPPKIYLVEPTSTTKLDLL